MEFTGERFTPDCVREIWYEHWHRYVFAQHFVENKTVLDLACGEGYGSFLLSQKAKHVIGMDVSKQSVEHAQENYVRPHLEYRVGNAAQIELADGAVDAVVSFETIEHLSQQREMIAEFHRVLSPEGVLIISSPDKKTYSDDRNYHNEFHVKELYREEFESLLSDYFPQFELAGQKLMFQSCIWDLAGEVDRVSIDLFNQHKQQLQPLKQAWQPLYLIALCQKSPGPSLLNRKSWLFSDTEESVYEHYYHEIRKNMSAGKIIQERDQMIAALKQKISQLEKEQS